MRCPISLLSLLLTVPASAQYVLHSEQGSGDFHYLGWSLATAGDVNGDGIVDMVLGARGGGPGGEGAVRVLSGADASLLHEFVGAQPLDHLGQAVAGVGDVDGDGLADLAIGAPRNQFPQGCCPGYVRIHSGADGALLHELVAPSGFREFGNSLTGPGDVDGDGVPDVVVGDPYSAEGGYGLGAVHVHSGATGQRLYAVYGTSTFGRFGQDLTAAGDQDGDGRADFLVTADRHGPNGSGTAFVLSGVDGSVLLEIPSPTPSNDAAFGRSATVLGDVDGDGRLDFLVAATGAQRVFVISGATGANLLTVQQPVSTFSDRQHDVVARVADLDGDGRSDALIGTGSAARVLSSATGQVLVDLVGGDGFGHAVASPGDLLGDGRPELLVAAILDDAGGFNAGRVDLVRLAPQDVSAYCDPGPNSTGGPCLLDVEGSTSIELADLVLVATGGPPAQPGLFFYGAEQVAVPFGNGLRCVGGPELFRLSPPLVLDGTGSGARALDYGAPPLSSGAGAVVPGSTWNLQLWYRDPAAGGFDLSNALAIVFSH